MTDAIIKRPDLPSLVASAASYGKSTVTDKTRERWRRDFLKFEAWCKEYNLQAMPADPAIVAVFLSALADGHVKAEWLDRQGNPRSQQKALRYTTIEHCYFSIAQTHRMNGHEWPQALPTIVKVMKGIRRRLGTKKKRMAPLEIADFKRCIESLRERRYDDLVAVRDRAILAIGFWGAFRRGEIVALNIEDLEFVKEGMVVHLRKSKTDQDGKGDDVAILFCKDESCCAVKLVRAWLDRSGLKSGPLFRRMDYRSDAIGDKHMHGDVVAELVKRVAEATGLDADRFAGHSLRAGFVTSAAHAGKSLHNIMRQTRHRDERVAMSYIRPANLFRDNAAEGLGDEPEEKK